MPIKINLLAESQAAAELRRRDPVKRGIWVGCFCVSVVLIWLLKLQLDIYFSQSDYGRVEKQYNDINVKYSTVTNSQIKTAEINQKLDALAQLSTNRFLWAPLLNALQKSAMDNIQVTRLAGDQEYSMEDPRILGSGSTKRIIPGNMVEKITLHVQAKDMTPNEQGFNKYKESLSSSDYFVKNLKRRDGFILENVLNGPGTEASDSSNQSVMFELVSHFPELRHGNK